VSAQNLHRVMGAKFEHAKPNLCPTCRFREAYGEWEGYCTAHKKILSAPNSEKGRCKDYEKQSESEATHDPN